MTDRKEDTILTKTDVDSILYKLGEKIEGSTAVYNCMQKRSVNFENWVQIELCEILIEKYSSAGYKIEAEETISKGQAIDTVIKDANENIKVGIEIKIILLGKSQIGKIEKDIKKLKAENNIILCIVYKMIGGEKRWDDYRKEIDIKVGKVGIEKTLFFKNKTPDNKIKEAFLYLNQWHGKRGNLPEESL